MRKGWQDTIREGVLQTLNSISSFRSDKRPSSPDDDDPISTSHSDASPWYSKRAPMPQAPRPQYLTRNVKDYVRNNDNVACDPIHILSDDEDFPSQPKDRPPRSDQQIQHSAGSPHFAHRKEIVTEYKAESSPAKPGEKRSHGTNLRPRARDEARLLGGLTRRDPSAVSIPDPMKRTFTRRPGYKPVDTLDRPRPGTRSSHIIEKTIPVRDLRRSSDDRAASAQGYRPQDHLDRPHKKPRLEAPRKFRISATSAINLEESEIEDDSADELQLSPNQTDQRTARKLRGHHRPNQAERLSLSRDTPGDHTAEVRERQAPRASREDESGFTRASAKQRRAEKDAILHSSSPAALDQVPASTISSPYFSKAGTTPQRSQNGQPQRPSTTLLEESPDVLQTDAPRTAVTRQRGSGKSLASAPIQEIGAMILGNHGSTATNRNKDFAAGKEAKNVVSFKLNELVYRNLADSSIYDVAIDVDRKEISLNVSKSLLGSEPLIKPRPIDKIIRIQHANGDCAIVGICFSRNGHVEDKMQLRFESERSAYDFVRRLQDVDGTLKVYTKDSAWMEKAFELGKATKSQNFDMLAPSHAGKTENEAPAITIAAQSAKMPNSEKRVRHIDRLDGPPTTSKTPTDKSGAESHRTQLLDQSQDPVQSDSRTSKSQDKTNVPVLQSRRSTRSRGTQESPADGTAVSDPGPKIKTLASDALGPSWTRDLVYKGPGKGAAIVPFEDLRRLDDDEYLNDNLISFFMKYLESHLEANTPDLYGRMYFFNTYFYEALTKGPQAKRGINYDAVSRWTKNINIFKRDFVVVPVNENLHWYLVIICNLPYLLPKSDIEGEAEDCSTFPESVDQHSAELHGRTDGPTDETQNSLADLSISDSQSTPKGSQKKGRRKFVRRSLPKYETDKPVIITLDSLGSARSATCSILRQYVAAEAKDKQNLEVDIGELRGMTAKGIPTQGNFSDCGLYLCMYLEQFAADPHAFVRRILQREGNAQGWPARIRSEDLRSRLRELTLELHRRQEGEPSVWTIPGVGSIMIDTEVGPPPLARPDLTRQEFEQAKLRFEAIANKGEGSDRRHSPLPSPEVIVPSSPLRDELVGAVSGTRRTPAKFADIEGVDYSDDAVVPSKASRLPSALRQSTESSPHINGNATTSFIQQARRPQQTGKQAVSSTSQSILHSNPSELAQGLRRQMKQGNPNKRQRIDDGEDTLRRRSRSTSASTDFLSGIQSYARQPSPLSSGHDGGISGPDNGRERTRTSPKVGPPPEATHGPRKRKRRLGSGHASHIGTDIELASRTSAVETREPDADPQRTEETSIEIYEDSDAGPVGQEMVGRPEEDEDGDMLFR